MPATPPAKKLPAAKQMAVRRRLPAAKAKAVAGATRRPRRLSAKEILSDRAADFFNSFLD